MFKEGKTGLGQKSLGRTTWSNWARRLGGNRFRKSRSEKMRRHAGTCKVKEAVFSYLPRRVWYGSRIGWPP